MNRSKRKPNIPNKITFTNAEAAKAVDDRKDKENKEQHSNKKVRFDTDKDTIENLQQDKEAALSSTADTDMANAEASSSENNNINKPIDWSEDAMNLDTEKSAQSGDFEKTFETLTDSAAETASGNQSSNKTEKGKSPETSTNEDDFIRIPRST